MQGGDDAPGLTREERELIALQTDMLRDSQSAAYQAQGLNRLLTPILLREAGFESQTAPEDIRNPEFDELQSRFGEVSKRVNEIDQQINFFNFQEDNPSQSSPLELSRIGRRFEENPEIRKLVREYNSLRSQLDKTPEFTTREGDILGVTPLSEIPESELSPEELRQRDIDDRRQDIELGLLERQEAALRGELPVNPALLSDLEEQEEMLRQQLAKNLGPGFETSTPGIEALAEFSSRREEILENARRGDIGFAQQLANNMGGFREGVSGSEFAKTGDILGQQFGVAGNLANVSQAFSGPLAFLQNERYSQFNANQQADPGETLAMLAAGYFTGGLAGAAGTGIANLFLDKQ